MTQENNNNNNNKYKMEDSQQPHLRYVAAVRQPHSDGLFVEASCCVGEGDDREPIKRFARYKLRAINENTNFHSFFFNHMGCWHVKGINGITYIVVASTNFPDDVAAECLDEFSEAYQQSSLKWFEKRRAVAQQACCSAIFAKYSSLDLDSEPWLLMNEVDQSCRLQYSKSVRKLVDEVKSLEEQMHNNIVKELENMERAEDLKALSDDCLEKAKVFRKKAKEVKRKKRWKNRIIKAKGVAIFATMGGVLGFLAGGPGGAYVLTGMSSVAGAEAVEAGVLALVFGASYLASQAKVEEWSFNQKLLVL